MYGVFTWESMQRWIARVIIEERVFSVAGLEASLRRIEAVVRRQFQRGEEIIRVIELLQLRLSSMRDFLLSVDSELDEDQRLLLSDFYRERNRVLIEIASIQSESRNRELNRVNDPSAFVSFAYTKGINFTAERRRVFDEFQQRNRARQAQQPRDDYGDEY